MKRERWSVRHAGNGETLTEVLRALGEDVANELVDWFNAVDATYRSELKELNELNFARFDDRVERRFAELRAEVNRQFADVERRMLRWMFGFWIATLVPLAGLMVGLGTILR